MALQGRWVIAVKSQLKISLMQSHHPSLKQLMKHIRVTRVTMVASIARVAGTSRVSRITWISNIAKVTDVLVDHHLVVEFANIVTAQFVDMCTVQLAYCGSAHIVDIAAIDEPDSASALVV